MHLSFVLGEQLILVQRFFKILIHIYSQCTQGCMQTRNMILRVPPYQRNASCLISKGASPFAAFSQHHQSNGTYANSIAKEKSHSGN